MSFVSRYRAGEWVEIKSKEEILATLDQQGAKDGLPFMPEMLKFCGQRIQVFASAHKTCDTVNHTAAHARRRAPRRDALRRRGSRRLSGAMPVLLEGRMAASGARRRGGCAGFAARTGGRCGARQIREHRA